VLYWLSIIFTAYIIEKKFKMEFLQNNHTQQLHSDVLQILDKLPVGILVYNTQNNNI
jgi:c-di-AMP phosphodiesterase-like protein